MRRLIAYAAAAALFVGCNSSRDTPDYTPQGVNNNGPVAPSQPFSNPPSRPPPPQPDAATDAGDVGDAGGDAGDAGDDAGADMTVDMAVDAAPDAGPDAAVECAGDGDCVLGVQLDNCEPCPIATTPASIEADAADCLAAYQGPNIALFEYEPFECHAACGNVSPLCDNPADGAACQDGVCVAQ